MDDAGDKCSTCNRDDCLGHGPCSICKKMFEDCQCTAEQKIQAWRDWFKENADPEKVQAILDKESEPEKNE